jgi:hypothetical protein
LISLAKAHATGANVVGVYPVGTRDDQGKAVGVSNSSA